MGAVAGILLAAGKGKRFKSKIPKVLHRLLGRPLFHFPALSFFDAFPQGKLVIVVSDKRLFHENLEGLPTKKIELVVQDQPLGTGDAVRKGMEVVDNAEVVAVLMGDAPLVRSRTLAKMYSVHTGENPDVTLLTAVLDNPKGYGRVKRDSTGKVVSIVEESDASAEDLEIKEVNAGLYMFDPVFLKSELGKLERDNVQREFYLTQLVKKANKVSDCVAEDPMEVLGINTRLDFEIAFKVFRERITSELSAKGVTFFDRESVLIEPEVEVGRDTLIYPGAVIEGKTKIGEGVVVGPYTRIVSSVIEDGVYIEGFSVIEESIVEKEAKVGPFSHIRPLSRIRTRAKIGNFVEIKKSEIGSGTKINHLAYVGDSKVGKNVNIGAGAITCNYDGFKKHETVIEDGAFIGSDVQLVAPVKVGKNAVVAAGSTITKEVPEGSLAVSRAKQKNIPNWSKRRLERKRGGKTS